jgi:hypothetical protein
VGDQHNAFYTVFVDGPREPKTNGQSLLAQISLSYLTTLSEGGAGALVHSYTPPFGPDAEFHDYKFSRFDRWSLSAIGIFQQLPPPSTLRVGFKVWNESIEHVCIFPGPS